MFSPAAIPFVEAVFFVIAPFDEVRANHELKIALTARLMNDVIVLKPFQGAIERFFVHRKHLGEIFLGDTDKTGLLTNIKRKPEEDAQSSRR